jgi:hypothetical protein
MGAFDWQPQQLAAEAMEDVLLANEGPENGMEEAEL